MTIFCAEGRIADASFHDQFKPIFYAADFDLAKVLTEEWMQGQEHPESTTGVQQPSESSYVFNRIHPSYGSLPFEVRIVAIEVYD